MRRLLFVVHTPGPNTLALRDAVIRGAGDAALADVELVVRAPPAATVDDVLAADAVIVGTTENFGSMAGLVKDFFERIYHPCLERKQGLPFALYVRAGTDGTGTVAAVTRIVTGLRWRYVQEPLLLAGDFQPGFEQQCELLGRTLAAGLDAGIY